MVRFLRVGVVLLIASLAGASSAAAKEFVYVANADPFGGYVAQFAVAGSGALLALNPATVPAGNHPTAVVASRDGRSLYVAENDSILQYDIRPNGKLRPKRPASVPSIDVYEPSALVLAPDGKRLYASSLWGKWIAAYDVGKDGRLSPAAVPVTRVDGPGRIVVSPDGRSLYATVELGGSVVQFDIGADGSLTPKSPSAVAAGSSPIGVAMSADGRHLYAVAVSSYAVFQFDVGAGGLLQPKTPASVSAGFAPIDIALSPDGRSAYVTNQGDANVSQYDVSPEGSLTLKAPATVPAEETASGLAFTADGKHLYVTNYGENVTRYDVGPSGKLIPMGIAAPGTQPSGIAVVTPRN